jgi:hypothetical protein
MTETCAKCVLLDDSQANDDIVSCHQCSKNVHAHCAGVEPLLYGFLIANKNLSWRCDDCVGIPPKMEINDCLGMIMGKLSAMSSDIEALKATAVPKMTFSDVFRRDGTPTSTKRRGGGEGPTSVKRSRVETPKVIVGTGAANNALIPVEPLQWLYVSRLDPSTSEESVVKLLSTAHNVPAANFTCIKLLPRMQNPSFISFKVGMSSELLSQSVVPDLWPIGVAVREFVNRPRSFFRPPGVRLPN